MILSSALEYSKITLFEGPQTSPACPSDIDRSKMSTITKFWWNGPEIK